MGVDLQAAGGAGEGCLQIWGWICKQTLRLEIHCKRRFRWRGNSMIFVGFGAAENVRKNFGAPHVRMKLDVWSKP